MQPIGIFDKINNHQDNQRINTFLNDKNYAVIGKQILDKQQVDY